MSRLFKDIEAHATGATKLDYNRNLDVSTCYFSPPMSEATEYRIQVRLGSTGYSKDTKSLNRLKEFAIRDITEYVFGEFRDYFIEIQHHLYNRDYEGAMDKLKEMEELMYNNKEHP